MTNKYHHVLLIFLSTTSLTYFGGTNSSCEWRRGQKPLIRLTSEKPASAWMRDIHEECFILASRQDKKPQRTSQANASKPELGSPCDEWDGETEWFPVSRLKLFS